MKRDIDKKCYCYTCRKWFHWLGITRHRAMHRDKKEYCKIRFTNGDIAEWHYDELNDLDRPDLA